MKLKTLLSARRDNKNTESIDGSTSRRFRGDRGSGAFFMLLMMPVLVGFAGLAFDAGMAFNARREASGVASAAARAGADQIDTDWLYFTGLPRLDQGAAQSRALSFANAAGADAATANADDFEILVTVQMNHNPIFLDAFGLGTFQVIGEGRANVESAYQ